MATADDYAGSLDNDEDNLALSAVDSLGVNRDGLAPAADENEEYEDNLVPLVGDDKDTLAPLAENAITKKL